MELSDFCWLDSIFGSTPAAVWARPELIGVMNWSHLRMRKGISAIIEKFPFVGCKKLRRNLLSIFHFESYRLDGRDDDKTSNNSHRQRQQKLKSSTSQSDDKWTSLSLIIWRHLSISCQEINGSTNLMELNLNLSIMGCWETTSVVLRTAILHLRKNIRFGPRRTKQHLPSFFFRSLKSSFLFRWI